MSYANSFISNHTDTSVNRPKLQLATGTEHSLRAPQSPAWPYLWSEEEMISRYGLRRLTETEAAVFPGIPLALRVFKAQLTRPPAVVPRARKGWVVWLVETYPGCFLARLPGAGTIHANHSQMEWTAVPDETPVTAVTAPTFWLTC
jgi:hypothetical protein